MSWFIIDQLFIKNDIRAQWEFFVMNLEPRKLFYLFIALLLMFANWGLEAVKWRVLIQSPILFGKLIRAIVAGITIGMITPGRGGEFIGRALFLDEQNKAKVFYLSSIGGIAQTTVTLIAGVFCIYLWRDDSFLLGLTLGVSIIFLLLYFRFDLLNRFISSSSFLQRYSLVISERDLPDIGIQVRVLLISFLRFCVYLSQYVLLLFAFGEINSIPVLAVYSGVFLLVQTFSPLMPLIDISFRAGSALYIFSELTRNDIAVVFAVTCVWLINLVIPSLIGYLFILKKRTFAHVVR